MLKVWRIKRQVEERELIIDRGESRKNEKGVFLRGAVDRGEADDCFALMQDEEEGLIMD